MSKANGKLVELAHAKLQSSGLDPAKAKAMGVEWLTREETIALHHRFQPLMSLKLNYFDHNGKPAADLPGGKQFFRARYLEVGTGFDAVSEKKESRYVQMPNTLPVAYYPKIQDFSDIINNKDAPLIITEGELKALKACTEGFPTIGLGGVWNFRSANQGIEWLPSLEPILWLRRNVYICFDSDYRSNKQVCGALQELAYQLHRRGALVFLVSLPALPELKKVGLDDYLIHQAPEQFSNLLHLAEPLGLTRTLFDFNERYVYVRNPGMIVERGTHMKIAPEVFKSHLEATAEYQELELNKEGKISYKTVSAAPAWIKWPLRSTAQNMTYAPGKEEFVTTGEHIALNTWKGWGCEPKKGDVTPFIKLLDHLFTGAEAEAKEWFLRWAAFPLQYPGTKMFASVLFHGVTHGTGKSLVGYTLGKIYGENFAEIDHDDLYNGDNDWAENKQFVLGDDIAGQNKRTDSFKLKKKITQKTIRINIKYVPTYSIPDCINYFFTANEPDTLFLEDTDRRNFVLEVIAQPLPEEFYVDYQMWLDGGGGAALFHYLLNLDLGDFNPAAPAYRTAAKERMISTVQSDMGSWVRELLSNPDYVLRVGSIRLKRDLYTAKELLDLYNPAGDRQVTAMGLGRELSRAGIRQVSNGSPIKLSDGSQGRYFAVRNHNKWILAQQSECKAHLEATLVVVEPKKRY